MQSVFFVSIFLQSVSSIENWLNLYLCLALPIKWQTGNASRAFTASTAFTEHHKKPDLVEATVDQLDSTGRGLLAYSGCKGDGEGDPLLFVRSENIKFQNATRSNTSARYCPF